MRKRPRPRPGDLVPHPRYGTTSRPRLGDRIAPARLKLTREEIAQSYWGYRGPGVTIFPESAIAADLSRQNFSVVPRTYYVDLLRTCRGCGRPFIFFAREQKHWYETLGFFVDADCVRCVECRQSDRRFRRRFQRYAEHVGRPDLSDKELATLLKDAVFLFEAGVLRNEQRLRRLKNVALARIPSDPAAERIARLIGELEDERKRTALDPP